MEVVSIEKENQEISFLYPKGPKIKSMKGEVSIDKENQEVSLTPKLNSQTMVELDFVGHSPMGNLITMFELGVYQKKPYDHSREILDVSPIIGFDQSNLGIRQELSLVPFGVSIPCGS